MPRWFSEKQYMQKVNLENAGIVQIKDSLTEGDAK